MEDKKKPRTLRLTDKTWKMLMNLKSRPDKSWDLFFIELFEVIKRIKDL
jgi:hypothetical protein